MGSYWYFVLRYLAEKEKKKREATEGKKRCKKERKEKRMLKQKIKQRKGNA